MNIYEALKHDCRIRRKGWAEWHTIGNPATLTLECLKADDWEIEGPIIQLSKNDYLELLEECLKEEMAVRRYIYEGDITEEFHRGVLGKLTNKLFPKVFDEAADK